MAMCGKIEMEVPFTQYTANYLTVYSEMICSLLSKWHYLSAHSNFGFFSCVGYLHPKDCIKGVKNTFFNFRYLHEAPGSLRISVNIKNAIGWYKLFKSKFKNGVFTLFI